MKKNELNAVVAQRIEVAPGLLVLRVATDGWQLPLFNPGQFAVIGLPEEEPSGADAGHGSRGARLIRRAYSIASSSVEREYLEFYITRINSGILSPRLFDLGPGDRLWLGPKISGTFTLDLAPADKHVIMVATGTGLAPYMSMLRTVLPEDDSRLFVVLLGARHSWDLGYHAELVTMQRLHPDFSYLPVISRPHEEPVPWRGAVGYVMDLFEGGELEKALGFTPSPGDSSVFLCGNPGMIDDMCKLLGTRGFSKHSRKQPGEIFVERYW